MPDRGPTLRSLAQQVETLEQEIAGLRRQQRHNSRPSRQEPANADTGVGETVLTWFAVLLAFSIGICLAWANIADKFSTVYKGKTYKIGDHPGYDEIFWWTFGIGAVLITFAAFAVVVIGYMSATTRNLDDATARMESAAEAPSDQRVGYHVSARD